MKLPGKHALATILAAGLGQAVASAQSPLAEIAMDAPLYSPPAPLGDALYLATASQLQLVAARP